MKRIWLISTALAGALILSGGASLAQDSVSIVGCYPGDAVSPWDDASTLFGSEQSNAYVVDMTPIFSSWGYDFGLAPIAKTGKSSLGFFNSLMGAQGISRHVLSARKFDATTYYFWQGQGYGINNDPSLNMPGTALDAADLRGAQFAAAFRDFGSTDGGTDYNGLVTAIVNVDPSNTSRLYVHRIQTALGSCDAYSELATIGVGAVDAEGNTAFRADNNNITTGGCGDSVISGNNIYLVDASNRNFAMRNVLSGTGNLLDPITKWLVALSATTYACPTLMPATVNGGQALYMGGDFSSQFARGTSAATMIIDSTHLPAGVTQTRGNMSYTARNSTLLGSTQGMGAILAYGTTGNADTFVLFGMGANGVVSGKMALTLPATVVDNATGFTNLGPGPNEFDHYHSQVPFQGGNGNVALNVDPLGNILLAAETDHPTDTGATHAGNYIAVARVNASGVSWTMAGYNDNATGGKPILNGPSGLGGIPIGQMVPMPMLGGTTLGPSVSAPMIDSAGNVWFLSAIELFGTSDFTIGLLRAVYDPFTFKYELELILTLGDQFYAANSQLNYVLTDLRIADSNSVDSATCWSGNVSESAFLGYNPTYFEPADPRSLGGIVLQARILYDADKDGVFDDDCNDATPSMDEEYRVLLYIGSTAPSGYASYGQACTGSGGFKPLLHMDGYPTAGSTVSLHIEQGVGGQLAMLLFGLFPGAIPFGVNNCFLNVTPVVGPQILLPLLGSGPGNGAISLSAALPLTSPPGTFTMQAFCGDPGTPEGMTSTKGLQMTIFP
ncbi:MAG: hypothetical protein HY812_18800 [Planctomycetes bacterium]|nr:hypothetical protein [Planctomycetota bacterium]